MRREREKVEKVREFAVIFDKAECTWMAEGDSVLPQDPVEVQFPV